MKKVLILFDADNWENHIPFTHKPQYKEGYEALYLRGREFGVEFFRAAVNWYNAETKTFRALTFDGEWKKVEAVQPDIVYDKISIGQFLKRLPEVLDIEHDFRYVNDVHFTMLIENKSYLHILFPEWTKSLQLLSTTTQLQHALTQWSAERVVLKAPLSSSGKEVYILTKEEAQQFEVTQPLLLQEFIETSGGIPGVVSDRHDLRLMFYGEKLICSYIRVPAKGSYLANIAQGGQMIIIEPEQIPESVQPLLADVFKTFSAFPNAIFSIDLLFDEQHRPWVIECNARPGLYFAPHQLETRQHVHDELIYFFRDLT